MRYTLKMTPAVVFPFSLSNQACPEPQEQISIGIIPHNTSVNSGFSSILARDTWTNLYYTHCLYCNVVYVNSWLRACRALMIHLIKSLMHISPTVQHRYCIANVEWKNTLTWLWLQLVSGQRKTAERRQHWKCTPLKCPTKLVVLWANVAPIARLSCLVALRQKCITGPN